MHGTEINKFTTSAKQLNKLQISDSNNICKELIKSISKGNEVTRHIDDEPGITRTKNPFLYNLNVIVTKLYYYSYSYYKI